MTDAQIHCRILGGMVGDLIREAAFLEEEAGRLLSLPAPMKRHPKETAIRMVEYRIRKAEEHRRGAAMLHRRIEALKAGIESLEKDIKNEAADLDT